MKRKKVCQGSFPEITSRLINVSGKKCRVGLRNSVVSAVVAMILLNSATARAYLPPKFGGTLKVAIPSRVLKIDPTIATEDHEFMVAGCIFETLIAQGTGDTLIPVLVEELPVVSEDGLKYYFKLRDGIKFHDGTPLDSADVIHSFKQLVSNRRSPYAWIFKDVSGIEKFRSGGTRSLEGMKITDPLRFEIVLTRENRNFMRYLTFPAASIIPTADREYEPPVGTGPFRYVTRNAKGEIIVSANPDYWKGRPYLDAIEFLPVRNERDRVTEFIKGDTDVIDVPLGGSGLEDGSLFMSPVSGPMKRIFFLDINPGYKATGTPDAVSGISAIVDRRGIVRSILGGNGSAEVNIPTENKAGIKAKPGGGELSLWFPDYAPGLRDVARKVSYDMEAKGYKVVPREVSPQGILQYSANDAPAMILRSMPVFFSVEESFRISLNDPDYNTRTSSLAVRLGHLENPASHAGFIVMIFSRKSSYICQKNVQGLTAGPHGDVLFENVFIRKPTPETELLEN